MERPNFVLLDCTLPEVQARDAVERRVWSHPQEPVNEERWADVLADPRAGMPVRRSGQRAVRPELVAGRAVHGSAMSARPSLLIRSDSRSFWGALFFVVSAAGALPGIASATGCPP